MKAKCIIFSQPNKVEMGSLKVEELRTDEVLLKTHYTLISVGTEIRNLAKGKTFPIVPGYSGVSEVIKCGKGVRNIRVGEIVFSHNFNFKDEKLGSMWGAHSEITIHKSNEVYPIWGKLPEANWTFQQVLAIAIHAINLSGAESGNCVSVIGQGLMGILCTKVLMARGCNIVVFEIGERRLKRAKDLGVYAFNPKDDNPECLLQGIWGRLADIVIESSSTISGIQFGLKCLNPKPEDKENGYHARMVLLANYTQDIVIDPWSLTNTEAFVVGSRSCIKKDRYAAMQLLGHRLVTVDELITDTIPVGKAPWIFHDLKKNPDKHLGVILKWV